LENFQLIKQMQTNISNPNEPIIINSTDWILDIASNLYKLTVTHGLQTDKILTEMYNDKNEEETISVRIVDNNTLELKNSMPINGTLMINYSSTSSNGGGSVGDLSGFTTDDLTESLTKKYITPIQVNKLNNISDNAKKVESSLTNGNIKIDGAETSVYTHPLSHSPNIIAQDSNNRFVSDAKIASWDAKANTIHNHVIGDITNLQSTLDNKLVSSNIKAGSNITITSSGNDVTINASGGSNNINDSLSTSVINTYSIDKLNSTYIKQVANKSLIADSEITRLSSITNYDHTNVDTHMANNGIHVTSTDKTNLANVVANSHTHTNKTVIDKFTEVSGQPYYNGSAMGGGISDLTSFTTNDLVESTTKKYISPAEKTILSNTSGINTGDETIATIKTKLGQANSTTDGYVSSTDWNTFNNKLNTSNIKQGSNITITTSGSDITINSTGTGISTWNTFNL